MNKRYTDRLSQAKIDHICQIINRELIRKEGYQQQGLTARMLAERNGIHERDISAVTTEYYGGNFSSLLQRLRVKRACRMMSDKEYARLSCENIGLRCGFSSRQSLYNAFRKQHGMTPVEYRKQFLIPSS